MNEEMKKENGYIKKLRCESVRHMLPDGTIQAYKYKFI